MKYLHFLCICTLLVMTSCKTETKTHLISIDTDYLIKNLKIISHDSLEGRLFGSLKNHQTQAYIASQFEALGVAPAFIDGYIQSFPHTFTGEERQEIYPIKNPASDFSNVPDTTIIGGNVAAILPGKIDKTIVITGHLDHLGIRDSLIYNGTDDNASGTAALLSFAKYFKEHPTRHTLIIAAVDGEEWGTIGSDYLLNQFPISLESVVLNINVDMIGRNEFNELYVAGTYHYPQLKPLLDGLDSDIKLLFGHDDPNDKELDDWTFSSDHRGFHERQIPFLYFGEEDHADYHQPTDIFDNIDKEYYIEAVKLVIQAIQACDTSLDQ